MNRIVNEGSTRGNEFREVRSRSSGSLWAIARTSDFILHAWKSCDILTKRCPSSHFKKIVLFAIGEKNMERGGCGSVVKTLVRNLL